MNDIKAYKSKKGWSEDKVMEVFSFIGIGTVAYVLFKSVLWLSWLVAYVFQLGQFNG